MVDASRIALIGYCFGGGVGIEFAATGAPLVANVAIHGSFRDRAPGWAANAKGMFLILHGAEDVGFPLTTGQRLIEEMRSAKLPFQYEVYSGTATAFPPRRTRPRSAPTSSRSARRANAQGAVRHLRSRHDGHGPFPRRDAPCRRAASPPAQGRRPARGGARRARGHRSAARRLSPRRRRPRFSLATPGIRATFGDAGLS